MVGRENCNGNISFMRFIGFESPGAVRNNAGVDSAGPIFIGELEAEFFFHRPILHQLLELLEIDENLA